MSKVLVVDNDVDVLTVVKLILSANGFVVEAISDWRNTFEKIESFNPQLILLDVSLGGEDGRNICRKIKSGTAHKNIPVILFSAKIGEIALEDCKADGFIAKPFDATHLVTMLKFYMTSTN